MEDAAKTELLAGEVSPCPFCGEGKNIALTVLDLEDYKSVWVFCVSCGARAPSVNWDTVGQISAAKKKAIEIWNKRFPDA